MADVINEIKNWHQFTEKFGEEYQMHDAVIKRFDWNGDELIVVVNTLYEMDDDKVYDITLKFSIELLSIAESEPFQRGMIWLEDPDQTADSGKRMFRT